METTRERPLPKSEGPWGRFQTRVADGLQWFINHAYRPSLELGLKWRYATAAVGVATLIITLGFVGAGWISFVFMPPVESDFISASLTMPQGTPVEVTSEAVRVLEQSAMGVRREMEEETGKDPFQTVSASIGGQSRAQQGPPGMTERSGVVGSPGRGLHRVGPGRGTGLHQ